MNKEKYLLSLLFLSAIFYSGCSSSENTILLRDQFVKARLIGTWRTNEFYELKKETIKFNDDNSFIDTLFLPVPEIKDSYFTKYVAEGKYYIKEGEINYTDVKFDYYNDLYNPLAESAFEFFDPNMPNLDDEFILFGKIVSLNRISGNDSIAGKWEILHWAATMEANSDEKFKGGLVRETYEFFPDSNLCRYKREFLFKTDLPDVDKFYKYRTNNSYLEIEPIIYAWFSINGNKMNIWGSSENMLYEKIN